MDLWCLWQCFNCTLDHIVHFSQGFSHVKTVKTATTDIEISNMQRAAKISSISAIQFLSSCLNLSSLSTILQFLSTKNQREQQIIIPSKQAKYAFVTKNAAKYNNNLFDTNLVQYISHPAKNSEKSSTRLSIFFGQYIKDIHMIPNLSPLQSKALFIYPVY